MDQCLQVREVVDQKIRRSIFERLGRIAVSDAASLNVRVPPSENIHSRVADHPCPFTMALGVGKDLVNTDGIRFLVIETITAINRCEMLVDPKAIEHRTAEMNRFVGQYGEFAI